MSSLPTYLILAPTPIFPPQPKGMVSWEPEKEGSGCSLQVFSWLLLVLGQLGDPTHSLLSRTISWDRTSMFLCKCIYLVNCSSSMFCSFLFISRRFSSPGFTRSLRTLPSPLRSVWPAASLGLFQDLMKLRFLMSDGRKNSVRDKVISKQ